MSVLTNEEINHIRTSVDIVDIISGYLPLTPKGKNYFGVCPFHDDHAPSMSVSKEKQIYTCFSCGATGNVFQFVMDYENISFPEALKLIASKAGIDISIGNVQKSTNIKNKELYDIYDVSTKFYQNNIHTSQGKIAKEYLQKRQIDGSLIKEFGIGLALKERDILTKLLVSKKYHYEDMVRSGLIIQNDYGYLDIYYHRIMFPLYDITGKIVGFSGRIYEGEDTSKYINTKETEIFKKGEILYNYHRAKDECRLKKRVIIMEGFMDVIRAYTIDVRNVVATMGTAVTKNQALLIKRLANEVILCFDGDKAGAKATLACAKELMNIDIVPKVVRLEEELDPDDYIKKYGKDQFLRKLDNPISLIDFKLDYFKNEHDLTNSEELAHYINLVVDELSLVDDEILKELTLHKVSEEVHLDIEFLRSKLKGKKGTAKIEPTLEKDKKNVTIKKLNKYQKAEQNLLYYMLRSKEVIKIYNKKITYMPTDRYRFLAREISYFYKQNGFIEVADFMTNLSDNQELMSALGEIMMLDLKENYTIDEIMDYIRVIKEYNIDYEMNRLKLEMGKTVDPIKKAEIAQKIVDLKIRGYEDDK